MNYAQEMLDFIYASPTSFQAIENIKKELIEAGFIEFNEAQPLTFEKGKNYFVTRNQSSVLAFKVGSKLENVSFNMVASHSDCPTYKVKPNALIKGNGYVKLNTEGYGGMIRHSWLDRPLSLAGRVLVRHENEIKSIVVNIDKDLMVIPSVAIHQARDDQGKQLNQQIDMLPLISMDEDFDLNTLLANEVGCEVDEVINFDLYLYPRVKGFMFDSLLSSYHLDNLECGFTSLKAFLQASHEDTVNVYACFDNEETGSRTRQGAASTFLIEMLRKVANDLSFDVNQALASSLMVSADNAHAIHPNHPERADQTNRPYLNKGIVVKYNANQSYTSDAMSCALFKECLKKSGTPIQYFTNRSDAVGGGTLGSISSSQVSVLSIDIGLAQFAMHSTLETAGQKDVDYMIEGLAAYYSSHIMKKDEGNYQVK
ncbi:MAG: M18 family aminopeptidase [Erysipelotrichaceae bacterium]